MDCRVKPGNDDADRSSSAAIGITPATIAVSDCHIASLIILAGGDMRSIVAAAIAALLVAPAFAVVTVAPAHAQGFGMTKSDKSKPGEKTPEEVAFERKQEQIEERASKRALSRVPDRNQKIDPWGNIR
jgi:hypothetical protein